MPASTQNPSRFDFIAGTGGMVAAMREKSWDTTVLGPVEDWPQSLRSAVSICLGSSFQIAIYWGPELALLYNDDWSPILGSKHPWALGRPAHEVWPEIWDTIGPLFASVIETGQATRSKDQLLAMHRHGFTEECYFDYTFSPIRSEQGAVGGIFNAVVETTFRVIAERRNAFVGELAKSLVDAASVDEICRDVDSQLCSDRRDLPFALLYTSDESATTLQLRASCGASLPEEVRPARIAVDDESHPFLIAKALRDNQPARVRDLNLSVGPIPIDVWPEPCTEVLVIPVPGVDAAQPAGVLVCGISPRLQLNAEYQHFLDRIAQTIGAALVRARSAESERHRAEELAKLDRAKTAFFSNASHEFRTPLTLLLAPIAEALARDENTVVALARDEVSLMHRNGLRLLKLVNTLLDFSRIESGRVDAMFEAVDLAQLTTDLASNFQSAMDRAGLRFTIDCEPPSRPIYVDRDMWEKIVLNLVSNAFKYTLSGGVSVRLRNVADGAVLEVSDTGVGVPEEAIPKLFDRFYRIENQRGRTLEGTGIGLALVHELVKLHGGSVSAESVVGQGTTLKVRLPAGSAHLPELHRSAARSSSTNIRADAFVEEAMRWLPQDEASSTGPVPDGVAYLDARMRLLIADDNADMRHYLKRIFGGLLELELVSDGEQAWELVDKGRIDIVLTDVMMPTLDGFGLLRRIRASEHRKHVPVVMLSARAGEEAGAEARAAGADDYIVKPFSARELTARVDAAWKLAQFRQASVEALKLSENMFRMISDQAPVMIWVADEAGLVTYLNRRWYEYTGQATGAAEARGWLACVHPDDAARARHEDVESARERRPFGVEYRLRRADGAYRWMLDSGVPRTDADGKFAGFIGTVVDVTEHREAERVLRRSNAELEAQVAQRTREFNTLWTLTPDILAIADRAGMFVDVNPAASTILGWARDELLSTPFASLLHPDDRARTLDEYAAQHAEGHATAHFENRYRCKDGSYRWITWAAFAAADRIYATGRDVTQVKQREEELHAAEEALRQASKMEAVGQLTGGIAHDFNNLLTVVIGNLDSLQRRLADDDASRLRRPAENAIAGARRAAALTQRLLAFARRQPLEPKPTDISKLVLSMSDMLTRTLGERVEIQTVFGAGLWRVEVDPNQLENALLNLALNARDAMPEGGKLTIETANAHLDEHYVARTNEVAPGQYVVLAVSDTGHGMTPDVLSRVFEPFFTTKPIGAGSGLGLAQIYGFVKQSGGQVKVYSEAGAGTTVRIYLPRLAADSDDVRDGDAATQVAPEPSAGETVLVVEDEAGVRDYSCDILTELGYRVVQARDGAEALRALEAHPEVNVLFTDVGLPGMTGRELADRALRLRPDLRILFTTGYARNAIVHHGRLDPGVHLLVKPFTYSDLAERIRRVIDGG